MFFFFCFLQKCTYAQYVSRLIPQSRVEKQYIWVLPWYRIVISMWNEFFQFNQNIRNTYSCTYSPPHTLSIAFCLLEYLPQLHSINISLLISMRCALIEIMCAQIDTNITSNNYEYNLCLGSRVHLTPSQTNAPLCLISWTNTSGNIGTIDSAECSRITYHTVEWICGRWHKWRKLNVEAWKTKYCFLNASSWGWTVPQLPVLFNNQKRIDVIKPVQTCIRIRMTLTIIHEKKKATCRLGAVGMRNDYIFYMYLQKSNLFLFHIVDISTYLLHK